MGMTMVEKILARASGLESVAPGDVVTVNVGTAVVIDQNFMHNRMREPKKVWDPDKITIMLDHIAPADSIMRASMHKGARRYLQKPRLRSCCTVQGGQIVGLGVGQVVVPAEYDCGGPQWPEVNLRLWMIEKPLVRRQKNSHSHSHQRMMTKACRGCLIEMASIGERR